jgi:hypothetical protein
MTSKARTVPHFDDARAKKAISQLVARLIDHGMGKIQLTPTQVRAIDIAIRTTTPAVAAAQERETHIMTHEEWLEKLV